jgi:putative copper export protein
VTTLEIVKWIHLLAASVWTGGLIVLAFLVLAIRKATDDIEVLRATARMFSAVSWTALGVAVITGTWMYTEFGLPWSQFSTKGTLIAVVAILTLVHQLTAKRTSPAIRGIVQLVIILVSIGIFAAAVTLVPGP